MVSIPDWAKFAQLADTKQQDSNALLSKFYKQREAEAVRQAEQSGYFLIPTEKVLQSQCAHLNSSSKQLSDFQLIRLTGVHLRVLGDVSLCTCLTICLLGNNFLTKIDTLIVCRHLIKLDVHSNQLTSLPGTGFWASLRKLQALHLHDNPLGKFELLQILGSSPCLSVLTLYDTPLSLKKNYRHHVVNSIWTLKALDHHVISDEEIIEDAVFTGHFNALSPALRIDLCPQSPSHFAFHQEMSLFQSIIGRINSILAKHSPVLIVQRCLRGYLARKRLGKIHGALDGKAFTLSGTPIMLQEHIQTTLSGQTVNYDTYMKNRRPGSIVPEEAIRKVQEQNEQPPNSQQSQRLHVNMEKLESGTLSCLQAETAAMETAMAEREAKGLMTSSRKEKVKKKEKEKVEESKSEVFRSRKVKDVKQFFGPVVESTAVEESSEYTSDEEIPLTDFRLKGCKPKLLVADATTEMILGRKEAGQFVREAEAERVKKESQQTPAKVTPHKFTYTEQRIFNRAQGTMGLSCLLAVHKAYKEREKAEKAAAKMENILGMREERQRAKDRISMYRDERRAQLLKARDMDRARIIDKLEKREVQRLNFLDKQQEGKVRKYDATKQLKADNSFMLEFNAQHTSVSNALLRHDRQAKQEDISTHRRTKISQAKDIEVEQQEVVKKYMEHRQLMRQTETAMAKAALDTKMLTEANERMMDARTRVAHQKARRASVQAFYPLPPSTLPPSSTAPAGMSRWEANVALSAGRVGRHNTIYA